MQGITETQPICGIRGAGVCGGQTHMTLWPCKGSSLPGPSSGHRPFWTGGLLRALAWYSSTPAMCIPLANPPILFWKNGATVWGCKSLNAWLKVAQTARTFILSLNEQPGGKCFQSCFTQPFDDAHTDSRTVSPQFLFCFTFLHGLHKCHNLMLPKTGREGRRGSLSTNPSLNPEESLSPEPLQTPPYTSLARTQSCASGLVISA